MSCFAELKVSSRLSDAATEGQSPANFSWQFLMTQISHEKYDHRRRDGGQSPQNFSRHGSLTWQIITDDKYDLIFFMTNINFYYSWQINPSYLEEGFGQARVIPPASPVIFFLKRYLVMNMILFLTKIWFWHIINFPIQSSSSWNISPINVQNDPILPLFNIAIFYLHIFETILRDEEIYGWDENEQWLWSSILPPFAYLHIVLLMDL